MKYKNVILIPPNLAYGDCLSVIGLLYYLLDYYDSVYFYLGDRTYLHNYYHNYFYNEPLYQKRIFIISDPEKIINQGGHGDYHICNTMTGDWSKPHTLFSELKNVDKEFYFNDLNPIYNKLDIPKNHKCQPNKHLPSNNLEINHLFYYELIGLNNTVRMEYFDYKRDIKKELTLKNEILESYGLTPNDKYNIINDPIGQSSQLLSYINNNYKTINLNFLSESPGRLLSLVEGAESIHLIEGCNVNFLYHSQYKNIFKYNNKINFYVWIRNRHWIFPNMNLDFAWKMMDTPKLDNWEFIFDKK